MSAMLEEIANYVRVMNGTDEAITGRYAGKDYTFKPGVPLDVPEVVAHHVFGFGADDKMPAMLRTGLKNLEALKKIRFTDPPELIEAPPKQRGRPKKAAALPPPGPDNEDDADDGDDDETGTAGPPVNAGGSGGGALINAPPNGPRIGEGSGEEDDSEF
jgi:hypothetical protein